MVAGQLAMLDSFCVRYWLGRYFGPEGLAVHTTTAPVVGLVQLALLAISMGVGVAVARSVGARDGRGQSIAANGVALAAAVWLAAAAATLACAGPLAAWLVEPPLAPEPVRAFLVGYVVLAVPLLGTATLVTTVGVSAGWGKLALIWGITHVPPVFALLPLTLGPLGLVDPGAGVAVAIAAAINAVTLAVLVRRRAAALHLGTAIDRAAVLDRRRWRDVLDVGLPPQLSRAVAWLVMIAVMLRVGEAGVVTLAGYGIAMIYVELLGFATGGFARAAQVLIAQSLGARRPARARAILAVALALGVAIPVALVAIAMAAAAPAVALFADRAEVAAEGVRAVRLMAVVLIPAAVWQVLMSAFAAAKATKRAFLLTLIAQALAFGVIAMWSGDRVVGALVALATMHGACVALYAALAVPVLWRGALRDHER